MRSRLFPFVLAFLVASVTFPLDAQRVYTTADYARAERLMNYNVKGLVVAHDEWHHLPARRTGVL